MHKRADSPRLSIVVLSHNRDDVLQSHLEYYLDRADDYGAEVIVVDNASTDTTPRLLSEVESKYPAARIIRSRRNLGVAGGRNLGISSSSAPFVLSLADDALLDSETWDRAIERFVAEPTLGILAPRVVHGVSGTEQGYRGITGDEIANFHGSGHFLRRDAVILAGMYDEYCTFGGEELDLSMRLLSLGYKTVFDEEIIVRHFSLERVGEVGLGRQTQWIRSYAYVLAKNLSCLDAITIANRRLLSHVYSTQGLSRLRVLGPFVSAHGSAEVLVESKTASLGRAELEG